MPVRKRNKYWEYYFEIGFDPKTKKRKRKSKGGFKTKKEAELALAEAINAFDSTGRIFNESKLSISEYMDFWYEKHVLKSCKYRTQVEYKRIIDTNINPYLGNYLLKNLTPAIIQSFLDNHYDRGIAKKTMDNIFCVLKYSLDMAVFPYEFIKDNPAKYIKIRYKFKPPKTNRVTKDEAFDVLRYLKENYFNQYIPFLIMFHSGIRKSECLGLQWDNIDLENKILHIRHQAQYREGKMILVETKTPSSVGDILIGDSLVNELLIYKEFISEKRLNHNFVCVNCDYNPLSVPNFGWITRKIYSTLNIRISAHSLRYLHGQLLLENKVSVKAIQGRLRHKSVKTTLQTYLTSSNVLDKNAIDVWEGML